jgi:hypothetical protein
MCEAGTAPFGSKDESGALQNMSPSQRGRPYSLMVSSELPFADRSSGTSDPAGTAASSRAQKREAKFAAEGSLRRPRPTPPSLLRSKRSLMRTLFGLFGPLFLFACLAAPAEADGMRPSNRGLSPFMFAPAPRVPRDPGPMLEHDHSFRGQGPARPFAVVNPGPVRFAEREGTLCPAARWV